MSSAPLASSRVRISLAPKPGFCIKTSTLGGAIPPFAHLSPHGQSAGRPPLSPTSIPVGLKVFINIAWDSKAPPSPRDSEEAILRALEGEDVDVDDATGLYIPAIVSSAREDKDKAGNPSLVFDCIYNTTVKARTLHNPDFKTFLIELSIQRIETQAGLILSRDIRTPNISSKGKLGPRTADVPASLFLDTSLASTSSSDPSSSKLNIPTPAEKADLIASQSPSTEVEPPSQFPDRIISTTKDQDDLTISWTGNDGRALPSLDWSWTKDDNGKLRIEIQLPSLTSALVRAATLDIEPRKMTLVIPNHRPFSINLELSDAEISSRIKPFSEPASDEAIDRHWEEETRRVLRLKRERDFEVEAAEAEWQVGSGSVVVYL